MCVHACTCTRNSMHVAVRGKLSGVGSLRQTDLGAQIQVIRFDIPLSHYVLILDITA